MLMNPIHITQEDPRASAAAALIDALSAEVARRYNDEDGSGGFSAEDVAGPGGAFLVAWLGERPVGSGALRPFRGEPGVGEIKRMYVVEDLRGQRIAQQILEKLEALAREFGYHTLKLETGTPQPEAMRLYERMGYQRIAPYGEYAADPLTACYGKRL
jgi:putative acetyltransferase